MTVLTELDLATLFFSLPWQARDEAFIYVFLTVFSFSIFFFPPSVAERFILFSGLFTPLFFAHGGGTFLRFFFPCASFQRATVFFSSASDFGPCRASLFWFFFSSRTRFFSSFFPNRFLSFFFAHGLAVFLFSLQTFCSSFLHALREPFAVFYFPPLTQTVFLSFASPPLPRSRALSFFVLLHATRFFSLPFPRPLREQPLPFSFLFTPKPFFFFFGSTLFRGAFFLRFFFFFHSHRPPPTVFSFRLFTAFSRAFAFVFLFFCICFLIEFYLFFFFLLELSFKTPIRYNSFKKFFDL